MQARLEALEAIVVEKDAQITAQNARIAELEAVQPAERSVNSRGAANDLPTFKVGKDTYQFTAPQFKLNGVLVKAAEASKEVKEQLVKECAGVIKLV